MTQDDPRNDTPPRPDPQPPPYEPPELKKYGSLTALTRSGTGTAMEGGMGPSRRFR